MANPLHVDSSPTVSVKNDGDSGVDSEINDIFGKQIASEQAHHIKYRTCSWQKTAALLFSEYICLAILSFPWSFSVLGMFPAVIVTIAVACSVQYTSLVLWRFCMKHPEVRDVCDIGRILGNGSQAAYNFTALMFILNNIFIMGLHCLVGAKLLNTLTNSSLCTTTFSAIAAIICFVFSVPRTLKQMSFLGVFSAATMAVSVFLAIIFAGVQEFPAKYNGVAPSATVFPVSSTTYVTGMSAFLNITYTFVGQITLPSFIAEMKDPKEFPRALWACTICELILFTLCGAIMYHFIGNEYMTAPAYGSLQPLFKKIAFGFAIPTIVYLGSLYASVSVRFVFFRIFADSHHRHSNTGVSWAVWIGIIAALWVAAFIIAELIPFFSDLLSLMSSLFDGFFGFIYWGMAYLTLYAPNQRWKGPQRTTETLLNYFLIIFGLYILIAGTYTSVQSIIDSYKASLYGGIFSCATNGI